MTLHWQQVRRARGLAMPLPPKPKRPLGPPVLYYWGDVAVRTRADIEASGQTWDEFLDAYAADVADNAIDIRRFEMNLDVLKLVPDEERRALNLDIRRRYMERRAAADPGEGRAAGSLLAAPPAVPFQAALDFLKYRLATRRTAQEAICQAVSDVEGDLPAVGSSHG
ncbi:hypothetical protein [Methylobacterium sp. Leaf106]|uniref:hypothetical protein n=1 Tax=Methylobacterium sp. Leaf106 TaxID=1736255 RepID=UPI0006F9F92C|nr:hypothetical protein [Methylobacterium sp. Leaf106]KQP50365.1 hypothetical protein ASF34_20020 [Methylobacterium sp. Leaf106]